MLITRIRKTYRNSSERSARKPLSVLIYTVDSETKRRHGYSTLYWKALTGNDYGVIKREIYKDGKLHGQQFYYSMFYPQYRGPGEVFRLERVVHYHENKKEGPEIEYNVKTRKPLTFTMNESGKAVYVHTFGETVDDFQIKMYEQRQGKAGHREFHFTSCNDIKYVRLDAFVTNKGQHFGRYIMRSLNDKGEIVYTKDMIYNADGLKIKGYQTDSKGSQLYELHKSVFTEAVIHVLGLDPKHTYVIKKDIYRDKLLINSLLSLHTHRSNTPVRIGLRVNSNLDYIFYAPGKHTNGTILTGKVRQAHRAFVNMSPRRQKLLYLYLLATAC